MLSPINYSRLLTALLAKNHNFILFQHAGDVGSGLDAGGRGGTGTAARTTVASALWVHFLSLF